MSGVAKSPRWSRTLRNASLVAFLAATGCRTLGPPPPGDTQEGIASVYADSLAGRKTASGQRYDPKKLTCAHRTLPFETRVEVRLKKSGAKAVCRVNDRGPFVRGRIIDLSRATARALGVRANDLYPVEIRVMD